MESERAQARQQYKVFEDQQSSGRMWADDPMMEGVREKVGDILNDDVDDISNDDVDDISNGDVDDISNDDVDN